MLRRSPSPSGCCMLPARRPRLPRSIDRSLCFLRFLLFKNAPSQPARRHHPYVPEVRPGQVPQPDGSRRRTWCRRRSSTCWPSASMRELTEEELARAVRIDPQPDRRAGAEPRGADGDAPRAEAEDPRHLRDRSRCRSRPRAATTTQGDQMQPPPKLARRGSSAAFADEQLYDLERLWYRADDEAPQFARAAGAAHRPCWARSTRSTSWPASTSSPAARR